LFVAPFGGAFAPGVAGDGKAADRRRGAFRIRNWRGFMDYIGMVFDRLNGAPDADARAAIYAACRAEVAAAHGEAGARERELAALEKAIRRQETQALYEESLTRGTQE
jgi:hypothetical protein